LLTLDNTGNGHHDGTLHSLAEQLAAAFVYASDRTGGVVSVCGTAAGAVELCPAILTVGPGVDVAGGKFLLNSCVVYTVPDVAQ